MICVKFYVLVGINKISVKNKTNKETNYHNSVLLMVTAAVVLFDLLKRLASIHPCSVFPPSVQRKIGFWWKLMISCISWQRGTVSGQQWDSVMCRWHHVFRLCRWLLWWLLLLLEEIADHIYLKSSPGCYLALILTLPDRQKKQKNEKRIKVQYVCQGDGWRKKTMPGENHSANPSLTSL